MHHFKYGIEKKKILVALDKLKTEVLELTENLTDQITVAKADIKNINEANDLMNILIKDNLSEYQKQEIKEWIEIHDAIENNKNKKIILNNFIYQCELKYKQSKELVEKKKSIIVYGKQLYTLLDKMDSVFSFTELKKDYRPIEKSNVLIEDSTKRSDIIIKCITKSSIQPFGYKSEIIHFEYLNNKNEFRFNDNVTITVENEFLKKIDFICHYLDLNNLRIYKEKDNDFFPVSTETFKVFELHKTDVGFDDNSFEFNLSLINHEIHESYNSYILNCPFRLRLLIDFILSYNR